MSKQKTQSPGTAENRGETAPLADSNGLGEERAAGPRDEQAGALAESMAGQRLDHALAAFLPGLGLRGRRRSIEQGRVLVNGQARPAAYRLRRADVIQMVPARGPGFEADSPPDSPATCAPNSLTDSPTKPDFAPAPSGPLAGTSEQARLLDQQGDWIFLYKPVGLHTAALAGGGGPSLEALLPSLLPPETGQQGQARLLQRLDLGTSGIVCAALSQEAARAFRWAEFLGRSEKRYLALVHGFLPGPFTARQALGVNSRRKSRLREREDEALRWTEFWPLWQWEGAQARALLRDLAAGPGRASSAAGSPAVPHSLTGPVPGMAPEKAAENTPDVALNTNEAQELPLSLVACCIRRGARHQIRAHAAALGHPLWGDSLYGPALPEAAGSSGDFFYLHHGGLLLPKAVCLVPPPWPLPEGAAQAALQWLHSGPQGRANVQD